MIEGVDMLRDKKEFILYVAVDEITNTFWDFHQNHWVAQISAECLSFDPGIVNASWVKNNERIVVCEYRAFQTKQYRSDEK
jgi:hypothetical protein